MELEHVYEGIRCTLSNENLKVGDKVYPIASGRCRDDGSWILHELNWEDYMSGFPDEPHHLMGFRQDRNNQYREVLTDHGSSPEACYYKITKKEVQVVEGTGIAKKSKWVVMEEQPNKG